ncbi:MAG: polymer-forming cytoskeletal protein [Chloroflexi bacterium]|nr:polymer-forming cytoskeletal protein [Chloroflexota bacterium]
MSLFRRDRVQGRRSAPPPSRPSTTTTPSNQTRDETQPTPAVTPSQRPSATTAPSPTTPSTPTPTPTPTRPTTTEFSRDAAAIIDRNTQLSGTLRSDGNVLIEGTFEGEIEAKETILVEREAQAQGQLRANNVIISGSFDGQIVCQNRFRVTPTGSIKGEINTSILVVEEGSTVNCRFVMSREGR